MRTQARAEGGFTLVELMVVVMLAGIVLGIAANALIQSQRSVAGTFQRQADLGEARSAVDAASADLRTLVRQADTYLLTATATEVSFFALRDVPQGQAPTRIRIVQEADGDLVSYSTRPPTSATSTSDPSVWDQAGLTTVRRVLASGLPAGQPIFSYYTSYTLVPVAPSPRVSPSASELPLQVPAGGGSAQVPSGSRLNVRFVEIQLQVQQAGARDVGATSVEQIVRLPNL